LKLPLKYLPVGLIGLLVLFGGIFWTHYWANILAGASLTAFVIMQLVYESRRKRRGNGSASSS
jgi:hypothetical protein